MGGEGNAFRYVANWVCSEEISAAAPFRGVQGRWVRRGMRVNCFSRRSCTNCEAVLVVEGMRSRAAVSVKRGSQYLNRDNVRGLLTRIGQIAQVRYGCRMSRAMQDTVKKGQMSEAKL